MFFKLISLTPAAILLLFTSILPNLAFTAETTDLSSYQLKLDRLQKSIADIQKHLNDTRGRRGHILTELKQLESEISKSARELKSTNRQLDTTRERIKQLQKDIDLLANQIHDQKTMLSNQVRSAYKLGTQQNLKMLLNQQDPAELGRLQVYFDYLNRAREQAISEFIQNIENKKDKEQKLADTQLHQQQSLKKQKSQERNLKTKRRKRNQMLSQLDIRINNQEQTLSELETSRTKIEDLLSSLAPLMADIPAADGNIRPFRELKGHLPWPVEGPLLAKYGTAKQQGDLKWNGVLIGSSYGDPVRAISHGRVAFSDWLQGYGFISIIDHGDDYMSLYGHNESLFKQVGDWVSAGEVIATAGDSGGQTGPALYFEMRSKGKPVNPNSWCSSKISHNTP